MADSEIGSASNGHFVGGATQVAASAGITALIDGAPRWSDRAEASATAASVVERYLQIGDKLLEHLNGAFALAIFDERTRALILANDRMGIIPIAWAFRSGRVFFASSAKTVAAAPSIQASIRPQAIYDYFFFHMIPGPESVFDGVAKVRAGVALTFNASNVRERNYWTPRFERSAAVPFDELKMRAVASMRDAVRTQYGGSSTGAFLSGGLDSSTVSGFLSEVAADKGQTFSIGFGVESFNELEYARITNKHFGCTGHEYEVTPRDIIDAIPVVASAFDEPFGNSSAIPTYACARFAKSLGMNRLLAGDGGDEIFGGNERYSKQKVFEFFGRVPRPLRRPIERIAGLIPAEGGLTPLRKLRSYIDQASIPLPERYETWNFVYREGARDIFSSEFVAEIDPIAPMRQMKAVYDSTPSTELLDRMLYYDWKFTLADNDLRKVTTMCNAAEIEVAFPMLDNRVVDLSIAVPNDLKMQGLELRSFFKRAMHGFLPDEILAKTKHGFGLPFGQWLKTHHELADLVYSSLHDLRSRGIIRPAFLENLIEEHRFGHPGYYGYLIWDLVILEEWLERTSAHMTSRTSLQHA